MTDALQKSQAVAKPGSSANSGPAEATKSWKERCCWKFNRNKCDKSSTECDWDHWCTYCSGWGHGFYNCRKRLKKTRSSNGNLSGGKGRN